VKGASEEGTSDIIQRTTNPEAFIGGGFKLRGVGDLNGKRKIAEDQGVVPSRRKCGISRGKGSKPIGKIGNALQCRDQWGGSFLSRGEFITLQDCRSMRRSPGGGGRINFGGELNRGKYRGSHGELRFKQRTEGGGRFIRVLLFQRTESSFSEEEKKKWVHRERDVRGGTLVKKITAYPFPIGLSDFFNLERKEGTEDRRKKVNLTKGIVRVGYRAKGGGGGGGEGITASR